MGLNAAMSRPASEKSKAQSGADGGPGEASACLRGMTVKLRSCPPPTSVTNASSEYLIGGSSGMPAKAGAGLTIIVGSIGKRLWRYQKVTASKSSRLSQRFQLWSVLAMYSRTFVLVEKSNMLSAGEYE